MLLFQGTAFEMVHWVLRNVTKCTVLVLLLQIAEDPMLTSADCCFYQRAEQNLPRKFHHVEGAERESAASAFTQHPVALIFLNIFFGPVTPFNTASFINYHVKLRFWDAVLFRPAIIKLQELEEHEQREIST